MYGPHSHIHTNFPALRGSSFLLWDMTTSDFYILESKFMLESAFLIDAHNPEIPLDVDAVDDSVSAVAD